MKRTDIYLSDVQYKFLKKEAKRTGINFSEIIRGMIGQCIDDRRRWLGYLSYRKRFELEMMRVKPKQTAIITRRHKRTIRKAA
jgi:hypothetical protein